MLVADIGCAMGFFSLPLAKMVGQNGKVICVDVQEKMIRSLEKRAQKAGLSGRIETIVCNDKSLGLDDFKEKIDFALAIGVVHEVPDSTRFFSEINEALKPAGMAVVSTQASSTSSSDSPSSYAKAAVRYAVNLSSTLALAMNSVSPTAKPSSPSASPSIPRSWPWNTTPISGLNDAPELRCEGTGAGWAA